MVFRVKQLRLEKGMSQAELAERSGLSRQAIIKIENDDIGRVRVKTIIAVASALDIEPADLFCK